MEENLNRIEISEEALKKNIASFRTLLSPTTKFTSVIKSNAYGHGILEVAEICLRAKVDVLGVNSLEEALLLRSKFKDAIILIMGEIPNKNLWKAELSDENFWIVVSRFEDVDFLSGLFPRPKIHLKTDTGMSRLGHSGTKMEEVLRDLSRAHLPLDGLLTHFASTEDFTEHSYSMLQLETFLKYYNLALSLGYKNLIRHTASSASSLLFEEARMDMVRVGISLYGLWPSLETRLSLSLMGKNFNLEPVLSWKTGIVHIQNVNAGVYVGYGSTYKTTVPTKIAVLPIGYYEGYDRRLSNQGHVLINGERAPILGRVCMNMTMVNVTHIQDVGIGTEVTLIGRSGKEIISADDLAGLTGTINYDVVTGIQKDIKRVIV